MSQPSQRTATYADLEALPPHRVGEIIFGALYSNPRPAPRHAVAANGLGDEVTGPFQKGRGGPGGWIFMTEPELHLGPHVVVPNLAGWRLDRLPNLPETSWIETPPDWLCEVLSPSTMQLDRTDKLRVYATYDVPHCWYVDPVAKTLEVFELRDGAYSIAATFRDDGPVTAPPFDVHTFNLNVLWPLDTVEGKSDS